MALTPNELKIMLDYDQAFAHAQKYIVPFLVQVNARGLMIDSAARKFSQFLQLPASSSRALAFLNIAWTAITAVVPGLALLKEVRAAGIAEQLTEASAAAGMIVLKNSNPGRVQRIANKGVEAVNKGKEAGEKGIGVYESGETLFGNGPDGMEAINRLDVSKGPIKELVNEAKMVVRAWSRTLDFLVKQKSMRLTYPDQLYSESLLSYARKRLPIPEIYSPDDLDRLEVEYLWHMIAAYVRDPANVELLYGTMDGWRIRGLNDTQENTIMELFGPAAKVRTYRPRMLSPHVEVILLEMGARHYQPKPDYSYNPYTDKQWRNAKGRIAP